MSSILENSHKDGECDMFDVVFEKRGGRMVMVAMERSVSGAEKGDMGGKEICVDGQ